MKEIINEYGGGVAAMVCAIAIVSLVGNLVLGAGSPVSQAVAEFARSICGGGY